MKALSDSYIPALRYHWLTRIYDPIVRFTTRERTFKGALLRQADIQAGYRVLDLGCGTGTLATMVKLSHRSAEMFGLDADPETLSLAREKMARVGLEVQLDQGFASALPYATASFDRVLSSLFFHHVSDKLKDQAMLEVRRVLRPGGEFHIADWGKPASSAMRLAFFGIQMLDGFATTRESVMGEFPERLSLAGFETVELTRNYSTLFGTLSLFRARKPRRGEETNRR
jgi:ubiquinone/menaquinone biosynthesis C-methylase UbiE